MSHPTEEDLIRDLEEYITTLYDTKKPSHKIVKLCKQISCISRENHEHQTSKFKCYFCFKRIFDRHSFYTCMCRVCGNINFEKRRATRDLSGKVAIVTGGRIKIGYYTALRLLECGATVIITTRFASDAIRRYEKEDGYPEWKDRLIVYQVDFLKLDDVLQFTHSVKQRFSKIHYLINNAAQTLARPSEFYREAARPLGYREAVCSNYIENGSVGSAVEVCSPHPVSLTNDKYNNREFFPDETDEHGQLLDLRPINSWVQTVGQVEVSEVATVMIINSIVPFILIQEFIPLLSDPIGKGSYIINVSSMEGKFSRNKTANHPHTNMAKAALNMLTRTTGEQLKNDHGIVVLSVDTGWNTIEEPLSYHMKSPIDCVDGMARILDPIFSGWDKSGKFLKNFRVSSW